jgi:hypothetical protein
MPEDMVLASRMSSNRAKGIELDPLERFATEERRVWRLAQQEMPEAERFENAHIYRDTDSFVLTFFSFFFLLKVPYSKCIFASVRESGRRVGSA